MAQHRGLKALLLDFDGTLVDLAVDWDGLRERLTALFREHGVEANLRPMGAGIRGALDDLGMQGLAEDELRRLEAEAYAVVEESEVSAVPRSKPVAGASELLEWARSNGVGTAVITRNSPVAVRDAIGRFGFPEPDLILGRGSLDAAVKPDPRLAEAALERLGSSRETAVLIGDSNIDLDMGRAAGVRTLLVRSDQTPPNAEAFADLRELLPAIGAGAPKDNPGPFIPIARPVMGEEERQAVLRVLESGQLAQGPIVHEFEEAFAERLGIREAVAVSSGTAALMLALQAAGVGPGDEVITSPFSFIASANAALYLGARPVFADISEEDFCIDPAEIERVITGKTKALVPVHLYGQPARMPEIAALAGRHGLALVEDAAQAHGATVDGRAAGTFGIGCFSFYATKNMTTGEGGMIMTDDPEAAAMVRILRDQGQAGARYHHDVLAYNWRLTEIAAAIGLVQLKRLAELNERRRRNAAYLSQRLKGIIPPTERPGCHHVYHQYTVRVPERRDAYVERLRLLGVGATVYYPLPIHQQPLYRDLGYGDSLPVAERLSREVVSLPVHPSLTDEELERIVAASNGFFEGGR